MNAAGAVVADRGTVHGPAADLAEAEATSIALLNCVFRELCEPELTDGAAAARLAGELVRARLARPFFPPTCRIGPPVEELTGHGWVPLDWRRLSRLVMSELERRTGTPNPEFMAQVASSHAGLKSILAARQPAVPMAQYLESEQALVAGHRFHPSPKAREGSPAEWLPYAPEVRARITPHWLAVRDDVVADEGETSVLDELGPRVPAGYRALPVHPWQESRLRPRLAAARAAGLLVDLGQTGPEVVPTSSVRTCYVPDRDVFLKFSLNMRITNCVRKNAWYELAGAVALTRALRPVFAAIDGCTLLGEPGFRSVTLADRVCHEGLGVIVREGPGPGPGTPLLAAAIADPYASSGAAVSRLLARAGGDAVAWWDAYVRLVVPPVLHAYLAHAVVLEPHLQNVLVAVDDGGRPVRTIFRDLEGTKLLPGPWAGLLATLPPRVAEAVTYGPEAGWNRVVYCLFVNHLAEVAAAIADLHPHLEPELWRVVRRWVERYADQHGGARLEALLGGASLPAKTNLLTRWARHADRRASYVPVPNPLV